MLGREIFKKADKIICVSNYEKKLVLKNMGIDGKKISVIPNGLNLEEFKGIHKKEKELKSLLYVGRLEKYKGVQFLLRVLPKLDDDVFVEIVGIGPYKQELKKLVSNLGLEERVIFYENLERKDLIQKFSDANIFVSLSTRESYGITIAEALALGTPCIVSNHSALREWVDGKDCLGIDYPPDIDTLSNLINILMGKITDYSSIKNRAPSWDTVAKKLIEIYNQIIKIDM